MERNFEINEKGHNIRCKIYYNKLPDIKKVVIFCHGFAGHKDNSAAAKFAERVLSKYKGIAVIVFNWPCHGDDVKKKLLLSDCGIYLELVIDYVKKQYQTDRIYAYATSFGGYVVLKYIAEHGNPFVKIALRCPAVAMYDVLANRVMNQEERELMQKGKNVSVGFDRKIEVNPQFLEDLQTADIRQHSYLEYADDILLIHGTKDEMVPLETVQEFSEDQVIELITVENADHRFQNQACMEAATKAVLNFFEF